MLQWILIGLGLAVGTVLLTSKSSSPYPYYGETNPLAIWIIVALIVVVIILIFLMRRK